ncbi:MAG TPA: universal stress protein [Methylomirabilota bacterium]|jgi:nucleotide-binding universal stress UspA family protein|nr:universal stress protein [Methylomirabilota bacterium]
MKILVPLDGSVTAEAALPLAMQLARADGSGLVLLMVANVHPAPEPAPCEQDLAPIREAQNYLDTARHHLVSGHQDVSTAVWRGAPAATIVRAAQVCGADRIVMTTHGRTGNHREIFGSVADAVLRTAPMSVIVTRPRRDQACAPAGDRARPAVDSR